MYNGLGVDHIGIGVDNVEKMRTFYQDILMLNKVIHSLPENDNPPLHQLVRTSPFIHSLTVLSQEEESIAIALVHTTTPAPRAIRCNFRYGDIGLAKITVATGNINQLYNELRNKVNFCSEPKHTVIPGRGNYDFVYCKDPEGNLIEFATGFLTKQENRPGAICSAGISVTDLSRSISFYRRYLGFDKVVIKPHETFSGLVDEVSGGAQTRVQSCVLANSRGGGMIELFEVINPRGRSIPFGTRWGDFGYLQTCLCGYDIDPVEKYFRKEGLEFLLEPQKIGSPESDMMAFLYISDPDGIPVEFFTIPEQI